MKSINISGVSALQVFQLVRFGTTALISILIVKLGATAEAVASYETFLWLTGMFSFFWVGGTMNAMLSLQKEYPQSQTFSNTALMLMWQSVVAVQVLVVFQLITGGNGIITAMAAGYLLFNTSAFLNEYIYYLTGNNKQLLTYSGASAALQIGLTVIPFIATGEILWAVSGMSILAIIKLFWLIALLRKHGDFTFNKTYISLLVKTSLPLTAAMLASGAAEYIDGYIVKHFYDEGSFAIFRYGSRELPLALILANTLSSAMITPITTDIKAGVEELKNRSLSLGKILFPISILLMLCSKYLFVFFYNESYLQSALIFNILLLLLIPRLVFPQTILTALKMNKLTLVSALLEIGLNVGASLTLMQYFGLAGIAYGTVIAYTFDKVFLMVMLYKNANIKPRQYIPIAQFMIGSIALIAAFAAAQLLP